MSLEDSDIKLLRAFLRGKRKRAGATNRGADASIMRAYARMALAAENGIGVHLSADEVFDIVNGDDAVNTAINNILEDLEEP